MDVPTRTAPEDERSATATADPTTATTIQAPPDQTSSPQMPPPTPPTMTATAPGETASQPVEGEDERAKLEQRARSGANWFYWIAALSLVNSLIVLFNGEWSFIVGLGATQVIDAVALVIAGEAGTGAPTAVALLLDSGVAGLFVMFGVFAGRHRAGAFITGMILYGLDGLIFLPFGDWLSFGFHVFALLGILAGFRASQRLKAMSAA